MANYVFKINADGQILPLDNGTLGVIDCSNGNIIPFANFYYDESYTFKVRQGTAVGDPSWIHAWAVCEGHSSALSRSGDLSRAGASAGLEIENYTGNAPFANIPSAFTRYGIHHDGSGGAEAKFNSLRFLEFPVAKSGNTEIISNTSAVKNLLGADNLFIKNSYDTNANNRVKVFAIELTGQDSSRWYYRLWIAEADATTFDSRSSFAYPAPGSTNDEISFIDGTTLLPVVDFLEDLTYTAKQDNTNLTSGTSIKSFHFFAAGDVGVIQGTSTRLTPVAYDNTPSSEPEFMGVYDMGYAGGNVADEVGTITVVHTEDGTTASCAESTSINSSGETMVLVTHTLGNGSYANNGMAWATQSQTYALTQYQQYGWVHTSTSPPPETTILTTSNSTTGCTAGFVVNQFNGYSGTPGATGYLLAGGTLNRATDYNSSQIAGVGISSAGSYTFNSLSQANYIPTANPNGTYDIRFYEASGQPGTGTEISNAAITGVAINSCPYMNVTTSQSGCTLNVSLSNVVGITSVKVKVSTYGGTYLQGSGGDLEQVVSVGTGSGSTSFNIGTVTNNPCETIYLVKIIDISSSSSNTTPLNFQNSAQLQQNWNKSSCTDNISITTNVTSSNCQILGTVTSASTCLPNAANPDHTKKEIKAQFFKSDGASSPSYSSVGETRVVSSDGFASSTAGFNLSSGVTNGDYKVIWYYNTGTIANPVWNAFSPAQEDLITVNSCPSVSATVSAGTGSSACGINIAVANATSLGSTIRAVVYVDTGTAGTFDGSESPVVGAKNVGGQTLDFSSNPSGTTLDFTVSNLPTTLYVNLDEVSTPNQNYIVELQADPDNNNTFVPLNHSSIGLTVGDTYYSSFTVNNCTVCAGNSTPYYFEVSGGNIVTTNGSGPATRGIKQCGTNTFHGFAGGYCKASSSEWQIIGPSSGTWTSFAQACAAGANDKNDITVRLYGSHQDTGQPLSLFTSGSNWTTPLPDGFYLVCSNNLPSPDADPCSTTYAFQIDTNGKIVSTNGQTGASLRAAAYVGTYSSRASTHQWGAGSALCFNGTSLTYEPIVHPSEQVARTSLGCAGKAAGTLYLFGNASGNLYVHTANNSEPSNRLTGNAGWYATCVQPTTGTTACASDEHFIYISSATGDWDGIVYNSSGGSDTVVATSNDWYDESPWSGWTAQATGTGWSGASPALAGAVGLCAGEYVNANNDSSNTVYVSGTLKNSTKDSDKLRIHRAANQQVPLTQGWYRYCGNPAALVANGVPEYRERFNCYGNPFVWYSAIPRASFVLDENNYLIHGDNIWWRDAAIKDLTDTNLDLGILNFRDTKYSSKSTVLRTDKAVSCISNHQNGGGASQSRKILKFDQTKKVNLSRAPYNYHPSASLGQPIISSASTEKTEVTIALIFDGETDGEIFKFTDIVSSSGNQVGTWEELEKEVAAGSTVTESWIELDKASSNIVLQTGKRTLAWNSSTNSASWNSPTVSNLSIGISGWSIVTIQATTSGHSIVINGHQSVSNTTPSYFCDGDIGITNLNAVLGDHAISMDFGELLFYNEELNASELEELEGYLSEKWCKQLTLSSHPYYADGPNCSGCESNCCEHEVNITSTKNTSANNIKLATTYKCSENVFGYQYKVTGMTGLSLTPGLYTQGANIPTSVSGKTFSATFSDPQNKGFTNYLVVDSSRNVWVIGHFYDSGSGDYDKVFPPTTAHKEMLTVTITETSSSPSQNWSAINPVLVKSESKINTPDAPHPVLATYYYNRIEKTQSPVSSYNGDSNEDGTVKLSDVQMIVAMIPDSHVSGGYDTSGKWSETLDSAGKGWHDVCDAVTTLLNIKNNGSGATTPSLPLVDNVVKSKVEAKSLLSLPACVNKLVPTECDPCPCPETREPEDCISKLWISDVTPFALNKQFSIITVRYQSSCCIDGYKIELGGWNIDAIGNTGFHDGAVYAPSSGNDIGQAATESHKNNWLHGITHDPDATGDTALTNAATIATLNLASASGVPFYTLPMPKEKLKFPIVWGMSLGNLISGTISSAYDGQAFEDALEAIRLGFGCIPATCPGESRVLTKFVVNNASFESRPFIKSFRLVTNDDLVSPDSFNSGSGITWTGDGADSDTTVDPNDWIEILYYLYLGWGRNTTWSDAAEQTTYRNAVKVFDAENDGQYLDIVDALTISNFQFKFGPRDSNSAAVIVPSDCCPCPTPGAFTVTLTEKPCNCWEEGYEEGKEGDITLTWTNSSDADAYTIYRYSKSAVQDTQMDKPSNAGLLQSNYATAINKATDGVLLVNEQFTSQYKKQNKSKYESSWMAVAKLPAGITTWVDKTPVKHEDCCPDEKLPDVVYVIVAHNDCGETSTKIAYKPECCNDVPVAKNVDLGTRTVNQPITFMADAFHPLAMNPFGGVSSKASAEIEFTGVPADDVYIKLIDYTGKVHNFIFKAGGGSNNATTTYINTTAANTTALLATALETAVETTASMSLIGTVSGSKVTFVQDDPSDPNNPANERHNRCGNTAIYVSDSTAITAPVAFAGGVSNCNEHIPGYPAACERLRFDIVDVNYVGGIPMSAGQFVGPGDMGGMLPVTNISGKWVWNPPFGFVGRVNFTYTVMNENGCLDRAIITVLYQPPRTKIECSTPPCGDPEYGNVTIKFEVPRGTAADAKILRKAAGDSTAWDTTGNTHTLVDEDGNPVIINLIEFSEDTVFTYTDTTISPPDECCDAGVSYQYAVLICQTDDYVPVATLTSPVPITSKFCTLSSVCVVEIPCCPAPHNPVPEICHSDCDGTAAKATIKIVDAGGISHGDTFTLVDSAGLSTTYIINGGVAPASGGGSGGSATVGFLGVGGGVSGKIAGAAAINTAINATSDANYSSVTNGIDTVTITQGSDGSVGNKTNTDAIGSTLVSNFACGFDASEHPKVRLAWSANVGGDSVISYDVYRREAGEIAWTQIEAIEDIQDSGYSFWDASSEKFAFIDDEITVTNYCDAPIVYEYAVVARSATATSGYPGDADWQNWATGSENQGDRCSPGGTTLRAVMKNCPPTPCIEPANIELCLDEEHTVDVSGLIGCIPLSPSGSEVSVAYSIVSSAAWLTPSITGTLISFDTRNINFGSVGAGPHNGAIVWRATISDSHCSGTYNGNINITLKDCGCPCPEDEKDYTICDVNYDNAEYVADGKLTTIEQIPFSLGREGSQNLRKGSPYMVSKGKIDCD